ncbi:DUF3024 domain-containing protein [Vibrio makurazakiensis]|uniref:DUF3024 domain-containing protein n=1 Tax=Vibrio makurazakiensis TaxID=2910250 RepID=UPI003D0C4FA4
MSVIHMEVSRLLISAKRLCMNRNANLPVELGKSMYEPCENGVTFSKAHYLLDSSHSEYISSVAKVTFDETVYRWLVFIPCDEEQDINWMPYPFLPSTENLNTILREIEKDPKSYFWS